MDGIDNEDPFLWDVGTVSRKLCAPDRPWAQDPVVLSRKIHEEEIDGKTLLIYEHVFSRKELMKSLGIKVARQKAALIEEIIGFQETSKEFRSWKREYLRKSSSTDPPPDTESYQVNHRQVTPVLQTSFDRIQSGDGVNPNHKAGQTSDEAGLTVVGAPVENPPTPAESNSLLALGPPIEERSGSVDPDALPSDDQSGPLRNDAPSAEVSGLESDERPSKKRRVAPVNLTSHPFIGVDRTLVAPGFQVPDPSQSTANAGGHGTGRHHASLYAYLGNSALNMSHVKSHIGLADSRLIELSDDSFATATTSIRSPPGLQLVVAGAMKNMLKKNARKEALARQGIAVIRSPSPSGSDEEIVDLDDLPDEWDEQTRREMEEEQAEIAARERELARYLPQERVEAILQEAVEEMKTSWEEKKLPRYQRRAYKLWTDSRKRERTKKLIFEAQRKAEAYEGRIKKLVAEILKERWSKEDQVRVQAKIIEQNLDDKLYHLWLIGLLESRAQPEKPNIVSRPRARFKAQSLSNEDEVLTSDDEMDGFIVDEEPPEVVSGKYVDFDGDSSRPDPSGLYDGDETMVVLDLTQVESPEQVPNSQAAGAYIDLTTLTDSKNSSPVKSARRLDDKETLDTPPPLDQLESVETIGTFTAAHWAKHKDRWRMVICMLFRLEHARRQSILGLLREKPIEEVWDASIQLQLSDPLTEKSQFEGVDEARVLAFDLTRIFFSFIRCRQANDARVREMGSKERSRLERAKEKLFLPFCAFIKEMAPHFPQDSQILRVEALDDDEDEDEDVGLELADEDGLPSSGRRRLVREVVQNKDALDLRERESRRIEEQEARRMKLRAALANSDFLASDKSRLIINESKQEDQGLIYINEDIGRRIKDHQINGVRFLWNQLIRDVEVRQGCLLAHTMGLGKTMQVITFLVAILEAAASVDMSVRSQIPEDLRDSQTLVLCPAGLVDNWVDEVLLWAPKGLLGDVRKLESSMSPSHRASTVRDWAQHGGLLIIGYDMFKKTFNNSTEDDLSDIERILIDTPNIVVADEAHTLKNPSSKVHQICTKFRTGSRIALTGTPLSNNVEEYYAMINWVAPNFLGPQKEFRVIYSNPIQQGLWSDSGPADKKEALKMMEVLKRTVAPKVHRATISCIKGDLPSKHEFVLFVAPTPLQKRLYDLYMTGMLRDQISQARIFSILNDLTLICNHPRCFRKVAQDVRQNPQADVESSLTENILSAVLKETNVQDLDDPRLSQKVELLLLILDEARLAKEKVLVFSQSIPTLNYLENLLTMQRRLVCRLDGGTKVSMRQEMIKSFNQGDREVYLISTKAGGVGLNIQGANRVVIFDIKWNPVVDQQAIGRAYRIGQQKTVYVYHFLVAGTFEEVLHSKAVFKMQLASRLVDKKNPVSWGKRFGVLQPIQPVPSRDLSPFLNQDIILNKLIGYKPNGEVIKQILSTDTFEEEDANSKVTPEMDAQIEELMRMENIRRNDPERYERMLVQKQMESLGPSQTSVDARQTPRNWRGANAMFPDAWLSNISSLDGANDDPPPYTPAQGPAAGVVSFSQAGLDVSTNAQPLAQVYCTIPCPSHVS